ncbi:MAG: AAA family ATPase, partial [Clostridia bacterium]|nr:AAA family ATPase [Clostridia bacterium]
MKRWYRALAAATLAAAACGLLLSLTLEAGAGLRSTVARALMAAALVGFAGTAVLRPQYQRAGAEGVSGAVDKKEAKACTFRDVAANDQALSSLTELRDYLKEPDRYARYGARMPRGVLLYGPPGTGKTLLARALAGEAGVPFFALSGSDFVEKYVGVGASRVRELFRKARKAGRCVIFIDEIDAMGKKRDDASSDERDQTLNALLSEMSGFHTRDGVVVIAATNRMEMLDPALLRPGRFDRQIEVGLPGRDERLSILKLHGRDKPMEDGVDWEGVAALTVGFSGASLENLLNEAAILAARRDAGVIHMEDVKRAFRKTVAGEDRPNLANVRERASIAIHEAGHALISRLLLPENRLARVSILPAGHGAAGYNLTIPAERVMLTRTAIEGQIRVLLAGRAAEQVVYGEAALTAGASSDIARATELASAMVLELGLAGEPAVSVQV